ncbi:hypothetical protein ACFQ5J_03690 [Lacticaseibacillus baoqingensis]|uniref:DUF2651 domain-containing protein n=1 Tax=Lacticaseibacillus baoqingensis TaxID=2486013 RepID=A0ABW4E5E1_9LACO|nr:hypothetical protein [Lacticaseibacillus baoqingensis]
MLIVLIDLLIFLITGGLLITIIARIPRPLNIVAVAIVGLILVLIAGKFFTWHSAFMILYLLWVILVIVGLFGLRYYLRHTH